VQPKPSPGRRSPKLVATGAFILPERRHCKGRYRKALMPLPDQEPPPLVIVQRKLLDSYSLSSLAIGGFDRAEKLVASQTLDGMRQRDRGPHG
jgi:hypothetical protein